MTLNKTVYLDNAASSFPKPPCVIKAVLDSLSENAANPGRSGHFLSEQAAADIYNVRTIIAEHFGLNGKEENVIFTSNATQAINTVLQGILKNGGHALISDMEHNSVLRPLVAMRNAGLCTFDVVDTRHGNIISAFESKIKADTRIIFVTHASNVTGQMLPVSELGNMCRRRKILFGLDASQTSGHFKYDLKNMPIDFLCSSGHKGLFGPQGTGILLINTDYALPPMIFGGTGSMSMSEIQPDILPEVLESGTVNTPGILGLGQGIKFLEANWNSIKTAEQTAFEYALRELKKLKTAVIFTPEKSQIPVLAFNINGVHSEKITSFLNSNGVCVRGGYHCSRLMHKLLQTETTGIVRASFGGFNTLSDAEKLIFCLKKC